MVRDGARLTRIVMENGAAFAATIFADATYEGDLMAQAGVSHTWGREGSAEYGESLAGVRDRTPKHQFQVEVPPRDRNGGLLPEVSAATVDPPGTADRKVQAYNFRVCMTQVAVEPRAVSEARRIHTRTLCAAGAHAGGDGSREARGLGVRRGAGPAAEAAIRWSG